MAVSNISDLTIGLQHSGMSTYKNSLKTEILSNTHKKLDDFNAFKTALDNAWVGKAKDNYWKQFEKQKNNVKEDIKKEHDDLEHRFQDLETFFFKTDEEMVEEVK